MSKKKIKEGPQVRMADGFANQRLIVVPQRVINRCKELPLVRDLYATHIGSFPIVPGHYVERPDGTPQAILIYCLAGRGFLELDGEGFEAAAGNALVVPPDTPHVYGADDVEPWSIFWIHFQGVKVAEVLDWLEVDGNHAIVNVPDIVLMHKLFENIYACLNYHYSNAGLLAMSTELIRFIGRMKINSVSHMEELRREDDRISETIEFMQGHLDINLSLEQLARQAGQSVSQYSSKFKEKVGESPINFHIHLKMRRACELLDGTDMKVSAIAELLGYKDAAYFSRYFKKFQGCSPLQYREVLKS